MKMDDYELALQDFQTIMEKDPQNSEVNADLKEARAEVTKRGGNTGFKKINIVEEDSEDEEEVSEMNM